MGRSVVAGRGGGASLAGLLLALGLLAAAALPVPPLAAQPREPAAVAPGEDAPRLSAPAPGEDASRLSAPAPGEDAPRLSAPELAGAVRSPGTGDAPRPTAAGNLPSPPARPASLYLRSDTAALPRPLQLPPTPRRGHRVSPVDSLSPPTAAPPRAGSAYVRAPRSTREVIAAAGVSGVSGAILFDLASGVLLDAHSRHVSLPPASTIKVATGARALEVLGPRFRFETRLLATGAVVEGRLQGDLVLQGSGDPFLDNGALLGLVESLGEYGIRAVDGEFRYDDTSLPGGATIDPTQADGEVASPGFGALNLNFNRVWLQARFPEGEDPEAEILAVADAVTVPANHVELRLAAAGETAGDRRRIRERGWLRHRQVAAGEMWEIDRDSLRRQPERWLPVRDPGRYTATVFRSLAARSGLHLRPPRRSAAPESGRELAIHRSLPLAELVAAMLDWSNNLTAEMLGLATSAALAAAATPPAGPPANLREGGLWLAEWVGSDFARYFRLVDHSGLGDQAWVTPAAFQPILTRSAELAGIWDNDIRSMLPVVAGVEPETPAGATPALVQAKTGTLHYVRGLVGYIRLGDGSGQELGFAIFSADLRRRQGMDGAAEDAGPPPDVAAARRWREGAVALELEILRNWILAFS